MNLDDLTREEKSLLLYLESRAVDQGGVVDVCHMNNEDIEIAEKWNKEGLIRYGRIKFNDMEEIQKRTGKGFGRASHWVELSDKAFALAHAERRARAARMFENRAWEKTGE